MKFWSLRYALYLAEDLDKEYSVKITMVFDSRADNQKDRIMKEKSEFEKAYSDRLEELEREEKARAAARKATQDETMQGTNLKKIDLCDPTQEPSDEDLARLMDCVALEALKRSENAAKALSTDIDREIAETLGRMS